MTYCFCNKIISFSWTILFLCAGVNPKKKGEKQKKNTNMSKTKKRIDRCRKVVHDKNPKLILGKQAVLSVSMSKISKIER